MGARKRTISRMRFSAHSGSVGGYGRAPLRGGVCSMLVLTLKGSKPVALMISRECQNLNVVMIAYSVFDRARSWVFPFGSIGRHSTVRSVHNQSHGTQKLRISSNRSGSSPRNPQTDNAAQFRLAGARAENETSLAVWVSSLESLKRPLTADKLQVQSSNAVSADTTSTNDGHD